MAFYVLNFNLYSPVYNLWFSLNALMPYTFSSQPEVKSRRGSSHYSFNPKDVRNVNGMISLMLGKKISIYMGEHDVNVSLPPSSSLSLPKNVLFMMCLLLHCTPLKLRRWKCLKRMSFQSSMPLHFLRSLIPLLLCLLSSFPFFLDT